MKPALELLDLLEDLERKGTSVIDLVRDGQPLLPWRLYPGESGIFDRRSGCQFYYHSHGADHEAGHFHTVRLFPDRIRRFHLGERVGPPPLVRFVTLIFQVFGPEIERLQNEKIAALAAHRAAHPGHDIFEDRSLEVLSRVEVDVRARAGDVVSTIPRCRTGDKPG